MFPEEVTLGVTPGGGEARRHERAEEPAHIRDEEGKCLACLRSEGRKVWLDKGRGKERKG